MVHSSTVHSSTAHSCETDACVVHPLTNLLAIVGPTASGKSTFSMALAKQAAQEGLPIEIISMDSALVYQGMDIGTAKPSQEDQTLVVHHGLDLIHPLQSYSAAHFAKDVLEWVRAIRQRGHQPVIVGGTMLYWRSLLQGLSDLPPTTPAIRQQIASKAKTVGWDALYAELLVLDPITANRLAPGDTQRVGRALEVFLMTGIPMSTFIAQAPYSDSRDASRFSHLLVSLEPDERSWLHTRMALRFEKMLGEGFLDEVEALMKIPGIHPDLPAMRCVGYRQAWKYLSGATPREHRELFIEESLAATRQLGKRQLTWLRAMPSRHLISAANEAAVKQGLSVCLDYLAKTKV